MTKHRQHFVDLLDRLKTDILKIDNSAINWIDSDNDNIDTCNQLIKELRERYEQISLSEKEQITLFKEIKPLFSSKLLFLGPVLRYYQGKPKNNLMGVRAYIKDTRASVNT